MKTLQNDKTPGEYLDYAVNKTGIPRDKFISLCLDQMVRSEQFINFAKGVPNLTVEQMQRCIDGQETEDDILLFLKLVPGVTSEQVQYCYNKIKESGNVSAVLS